MQRRTYLGLGASAACALAVACGADAELAEAMLKDAGALLVDAGTQLVDAGRAVDGGASAQPGVEAHALTCVDAYVRTVNQAGQVRRTIQRVAELQTNTDNITGVDAVVCEPEGSYAPDPCPAGATCDGSWRMPVGGCITVTVHLYPGVLRVPCGLGHNTLNGALEPGWLRWRTARVTIRR